LLLLLSTAETEFFVVGSRQRLAKTNRNATVSAQL